MHLITTSLQAFEVSNQPKVWTMEGIFNKTTTCTVLDHSLLGHKRHGLFL